MRVGWQLRSAIYAPLLRLPLYVWLGVTISLEWLINKAISRYSVFVHGEAPPPPITNLL